ncbi:hypothetical protein F5146DRAFT_1069012 [Armillaria mellea]|nr:hypothetical protein F5146DRAFT_1069012 [Armillaria mellea]
MPEKKEYVQSPFKAFITSPRRMLYAIAFFLVFALTTSQLGLVSQQLHNGGNDYANYPGMEYKHDLGLLLFSCVFTYLYLIGHLYAPGLGLITFFTFVGAVFWGTGAGVMFQVSPFRSYNLWIVAIQGIAWANCEYHQLSLDRALMLDMLGGLPNVTVLRALDIRKNLA